MKRCSLFRRKHRHRPCKVSSRFNSRYSSFSSRYHSDDPKDNQKTALVVGSSGALGSCVARHLSNDLGMRVIGSDVNDSPTTFEDLEEFVPIDEKDSLVNFTVNLSQGIDAFLKGAPNLDVIVCANGGWEGDPTIAALSSSSDPQTISERNLKLAAREYSESVMRMRHMNLDPVVASGFVAQHYMGEEGLMVVLGATAALQPTPGMMGYGLAKASTHHFIQTLGASTGRSLQSKSNRKEGRRVRQHLKSLDELAVVGILPSMLDTATNREADPDGNFDSWTKPADIAEEIGRWINKPLLRPHSGSLVKVYSRKDGPGAHFELVR